MIHYDTIHDLQCSLKHPNQKQIRTDRFSHLISYCTRCLFQNFALFERSEAECLSRVYLSTETLVPAVKSHTIRDMSQSEQDNNFYTFNTVTGD